jgi:DNA repair protein RecN (Recombination protein N)
MLKLLKIKNIALIHGVELELGPGLTLLTGETGAGKSILIDALGLLLGARASADLIRTGEDVAVVEALIESSDARAALERHGLPRRTTRRCGGRSSPRERDAPPSTARSCPWASCAS